MRAIQTSLNIHNCCTITYQNFTGPKNHTEGLKQTNNSTISASVANPLSAYFENVLDRLPTDPQTHHQSQSVTCFPKSNHKHKASGNLLKRVRLYMHLHKAHSRYQSNMFKLRALESTRESRSNRCREVNYIPQRLKNSLLILKDRAFQSRQIIQITVRTITH